jgi:hypothetical protein
VVRRGSKKPPRRRRATRPSGNETPRRSTSRLTGRYLYGLLGILWLGLGFVLVHATVADIRLDSGLHVTGSVERLVDATGSIGEGTALVTFVTAEGDRVHTSVYTGFFAGEPAPGRSVALAYDPRSPRHARLIGADDLSVPAILFGTVSFALAATYLTSRRRRPSVRISPSFGRPDVDMRTDGPVPGR